MRLKTNFMSIFEIDILKKEKDILKSMVINIIAMQSSPLKANI